MSAAEKVKVDYGVIRHKLREVLRTTPKSQDCTLAHLLGRGGSGGGIPGSRPLMHHRDFEKVPYKDAIYSLPDPHPVQLLGRYAECPQIDHQGEIVLPVMREFKTNRTQWRAANMANHILRKSKTDIWEVYGLTAEQWQNHSYRNTWKLVCRMMKEADHAALDAWLSACLARGLDI